MNVDPSKSNALAKLIHEGCSMANAIYNVAQRGRALDDEIKTMAKAQEDWDAALIEFRKEQDQ